MAEKKKQGPDMIKRRNARNARILVLVLICVAAGGIYYGVNNNLFTYRSGRTLKLPTIDAQIKSGSSDETFYISTDVTVVLNKSKNEKYTAINENVKETVTNLDYDLVRSEDISYIKDLIRDGLTGVIDAEVTVDVYISDLQTGRYPIVRENAEPRKATLPTIR